MRGVLHVVLHSYYVLLALAFLYGDSVASLRSWGEFVTFLRGLPVVEVAIAVLLFVDVSRAPDCDISCRGTFMGYIAHLPVRPLMRKHRGWYHSVWAAVYVSCLSAVLLSILAYAIEASSYALGVLPQLSVYRTAVTAFSASFLSFCLHLVEDSLTKRGVSWFGRKVRGPISTGASDSHLALLMITTSAGGAAAAYLATGTVGGSALLGMLVLMMEFALLTVWREALRI